MTAKELTLNIAVNLGRVSRWANEGKTARIQQFLKETESFLEQLEKSPRKNSFEPTLKVFKNKFFQLKNSSKFDYNFADDSLTWANILTHRAKLA